MSDSQPLVLVAQGQGSSAAYSVAGGFQMPDALNAYMWNQQARPLDSGLSWDPSFSTGFAAPAGSTVLGTDPAVAGSNAVQIAPDSSEIGVVIDSDSYAPSGGGQAPNGTLMPFTIEDGIAASRLVTPFTGGYGALLFHMDMQIPTQTGSVGQVVMYVDLHDRVSGRDLAYGLTIYDPRGAAELPVSYTAADPGTQNVVVTSLAGSSVGLAAPVAGSTPLQSHAWSGLHSFNFEITPQTLAAAAALANAGLGATPLSTDAADYTVSDISVDAEIPYFGIKTEMAYSVRDLTLTELLQPVVAAAAARADVAVQAGQTLTTASGVGSDVAMGAGSETLVAAGNDSVMLGSGADFVTARGGAVSVSGGSGTLVFYGGSGAVSVRAGQTAHDTINGGSGGGLLEGGSGGGNVLGAGAGATSLVGGGAGDSLFGGTGQDTLVASGAGGNILVAGSGPTLLVGAAGCQLWANGADTLQAGAGPEILAAIGGPGGASILAGSDDTIVATSLRHGDTVQGGAGKMLVFAGGSGAAADTVLGGAGNATILALGATDIQTTGGDNVVWCMGGNDTIGGGGGSTIAVVCGAGNDTLQLGQGDAEMFITNAAASLTLDGSAAGTVNVIGLASAAALHLATGGSAALAAMSEQVWNGVTVLNLAGGGHINLWGIQDTGLLVPSH